MGMRTGLMKRDERLPAGVIFNGRSRNRTTILTGPVRELRLIFIIMYLIKKIPYFA